MFYHWLVNLTFCTLKFFENFFIYCVVTGSRESSRDPKMDLHRFHVPGHPTVEGIRATPLRPLLKMAPRPPPASQAGPRRVEAAGAVRQMQDLIRYASHLPIQVQALGTTCLCQIMCSHCEDRTTGLKVLRHRAGSPTCCVWL